MTGFVILTHEQISNLLLDRSDLDKVLPIALSLADRVEELEGKLSAEKLHKENFRAALTQANKEKAELEAQLAREEAALDLCRKTGLEVCDLAEQAHREKAELEDKLEKAVELGLRACALADQHKAERDDMAMAYALLVCAEHGFIVE
jgi:phage regulator Rha-like protein